MNEYKFRYKYHKGAREVSASLTVTAWTLTDAEDACTEQLNEKHAGGWYWLSVTKTY